MMPKVKSSKVFNEFYGDPDRNELACDGDQLKEEPTSVQFHFFNHAPGVVKRYQGFPGFDPGFPEHAINTNMPSDSGNNENDPTYTHK
jgi:hypothetical protein